MIPRPLVLLCIAVLSACGGESSASEDSAPPPALNTADADTAGAEVTFVPTSVTLDYGAQQMEIRGRLRHAPGPTPARVWVWAYFVNPGVSQSGSWSDEPIEITQPFPHGDTATIAARGHFHWATNSDLPRAGYFARINVSARAPEDARVPSSSRIYNTDDAIQVKIKE